MVAAGCGLASGDGGGATGETGMVGAIEASNGCGIIAGMVGGTTGTVGVSGGVKGTCAAFGAGMVDMFSSKIFCTGCFCSLTLRLLQGASTVASGSPVALAWIAGVPGVLERLAMPFACKPCVMASTSAAHVGGRASGL